LRPAEDGAEYSVFQRGVETALRHARDGHPDADARVEEISAVASMVRRALNHEGLEPPPTSTANMSVHVAELRRLFLRELAQTADVCTLAGSVRVLDALEAVTDALERDPAYRFAGHFAAGSPLNSVMSLAHDMRSPLTSILFLVETLRAGHGGAITATQERQLGLVYSAAFGLSAMVNDVLLLTRDDNMRDSEPAPFSMSELMLSVKHIVEPIAEEKRLTVDLVLPEVDARLGHSIMLSRVLLNLVTNALKFTQEGSVTLATRQLTGSRVEFSVRDTGPGVPPEVLPSLFDAFRKLARRDGRGRAHVFSSAGLGLSICQTLVRSMGGGELKVDSKVGEGTCFSFELDLPLAPAIAMTD
jgi:signal transduction histidine kinase